MQRSKQFRTLNLWMVPLDDRACIFNDDFILTDNLTGDSENILSNPELKSLVTLPDPFKIEFTMILFCLGGSMRIQLNLTEYELNKNCILLVQQGSIGQCLEISPDCKLVFFAFSKNYFVVEPLHGAIIIRKFLMQQSMLRVTDEQMEEQMQIYRTLRQKIEQSDYYYKRDLIMSYMQVLCCNACQLMIPYVQMQEAQIGNRKKQIYDKFMELLQQYYATERSIGFYADKMCITPKYLSQMVYAVSGRHAGDWIRDYVILEAKALLKSRKYTIQQISDMLNFANQSFFGVYFKKEVGCSPKAYQNAK
ncbi:MAG TPA: helix-turn-helix domain-containing protein [Candidatus Alistipes merdigallinarum]|nr:helix-turn-helix domain-containing protein [Candidatus Alistipes merdigallinarum]